MFLARRYENFVTHRGKSDLLPPFCFPFSLAGQVILGLQNRSKLVAKSLKIAVYTGLRRGQNFSASEKKSVARLSPSEVAGARSPAACAFMALQYPASASPHA
jgi:hypothetical protein